MRRYYNRSVLLEIIGLWGLSASILYLLVTGKIRELTAPRTDWLLALCAVVFILWGVRLLRYVPQWHRTVRMKHYLLLIVPALLIFLPRGAMSAGQLISSANGRVHLAQTLIRPDARAVVDYGKTGEEVSVRIDEITQQQADAILRAEKAKTTPQKTPQEIRTPEAKHGENFTMTMPSGKQITVDGWHEARKHIDIDDEDFYPWLSELFLHPDRYEGYTITMRGYVFDDKHLGEKGFLLSRYLITCCIADAMPAGVLSVAEGELPEKDTWISATGTLQIREVGGQRMPTLNMQHFEKIEPLKEPYVYYTSY